MAKYQSKYTGKQIDEAVANQEVMAEKIEDAVENQKTMAEQIEKNHQIAIRNSKQIENLKQGAADQFETDSSIAYVKYVPENALPYAEIKKIGGMTYKDGNTLKSAKVTEVGIVGANIFDSAKFIEADWTKQDDVYFGKTSYFYDKFIGVNLASVPFRKGTQYILSLDGKNTLNDSGVSLIFYFVYTDGTKDYLQIKGNEWGKHVLISSASKDVSELRVTYTHTGETYIRNMIVAEYKGVDEFFPFTRNAFPIPEAVQSIDGYGLGVSDSVYNYIEWEKKQFVRQCKIVVLDGVNNKTSYVGNSDGFYHATFRLPQTPKFSLDFISNRFKKQYALGVGNIYIENGSLIMLNDDQTLTTVEAWNTWLQSNNIEIVYKIEEPEITDISDLITADNIIEVEGGGTLTFKNEYLHAVPSEVEYQVEV